MKFDEIIEELNEYLPDYIINSICFNEVKKTYKKLIKNEELFVEINNNIYQKSKKFKEVNNVSPSGFKNKILGMFTKTNISLSIDKNDKYEIMLLSLKKKQNNLYESIEILIRIDEKSSTWKITTSLENEDYYCFSYNTEFHTFNRDNEEIEIKNLENKKDEDFSKEFGIPLEDARKCRLNFNDNIEYINNSKKILMLETLDQEYDREKNYFTIPFNITEFATFVSEIEDITEEVNSEEQELQEDYEEYEEDEEYEEEPENDSEEDETEELDIDKIYEKAYTIQENLIGHLGETGKFIMSQNLYTSIQNYLYDQDGLLRTSGLIIRKLSNKYTLYYANITETGIILIQKNTSKEEILELYNNEPLNANIYGLPEFFETTKNYKLDK